ncbi:hypothetical protein Trisim1_002196 [Trichoderma cf. simile WF8]
MESREYANPLSYSASTAAGEKYSVPHDPAKVSPMVDEDILPGTQPIYHAAQECVALFKESLQLPKHQLTEAISLYQWKFKSWADCLGIFADKSVSLDTQLKPEPDARDLVMLVLDDLKEDLRLFINLILQRHTLFLGSGDTNSNDDTRLILSGAARGVLSDIVGSVDRLYRLIPRIEIGSGDELAFKDKVISFAKFLPKDSFEEKARLILKSSFPKAEDRLITKLVESIAFRRHRLLYQREYQTKMCSIWRPNAGIVPVKQQNPQKQRPHEHQNVSETEPGPSTKWTFVINNQADQQDDGCKRQTSTVFAVESVRIDETGYPIPPKAEGYSMFAICQICLQELKVVGNEDPMWWENHVDGDMKHYVCLSDSCKKSICYFGSFDSWLEHMNGEHLSDWPRRIYAKKSNWRCTVSEKCSRSFDDEGSLRRHLVSNHSSKPELTSLDPVVENSKFPQPRNPDICPLCEESIDDSKPTMEQQKEENDDSRNKVRRQSDGKQSVLGVLHNDEKGKRSAADANNWIGSSEMELKMAAHIADHLMGVSFLCLRGLEAEGGERQEEDSGTYVTGSDGSALDEYKL